MRYLDQKNPAQFYVIGLSYKKTDAQTRGLFSIGSEQQVELLQQAKLQHSDSTLLISTCNRTELYGFVTHPDILSELLVTHSNGSLELLKEVAYIYKGEEAVNHLFKVACGLDSQIIGDFEVIGQVKKSYQQSLAVKTSGVFLDRLINSVIQASRKVKFETELSSGATSVSFAGVQYIRSQFENLNDKRILLYGTGKLGRNTCENLIKHTDHHAITLINRSQEKANMLGKKFDIHVKNHKFLNDEVKQCDILFVATGAQIPTITKEHITNDSPILILDLSIPRNVDPQVADLPNVTLVHMDELSQRTNETLKNRKKYLPSAYKVMDELKDDFYAWVESRKMVPTITALNTKLKQYKDSELQKLTKTIGEREQEQMMIISDKIVQKLTGKFASYLRNNSTEFDRDLDFIQQIFKLEEIHTHE
jgi:glutamyl-tRNA reductase